MEICYKQFRMHCQLSGGSVLEMCQGRIPVSSVIYVIDLMWLISYKLTTWISYKLRCRSASIQTLAHGEVTAKDLEFLLISSVLVSDTAWCEKCQALHVVQ